MQTTKKSLLRRGCVIEAILIIIVVLVIMAIAGSGAKKPTSSSTLQPVTPTGVMVTQRERLSYRLERIKERRQQVARMSAGAVKEQMLKDLDANIAEIEQQLSTLN